MSENQEVHDLLGRLLHVMRAQQEALFKNNLAIYAAVEALKEIDADFNEAYERHYWEAKQGSIGDENASANRLIETIRQQIKQHEHQEAARAQGAD